MYAGNRYISQDEIVAYEDILIPIIERTCHIEKRLKDDKFLWDELYNYVVIICYVRDIV